MHGETVKLYSVTLHSAYNYRVRKKNVVFFIVMSGVSTEENKIG
jgi:hypothetical protein